MSQISSKRAKLGHTGNITGTPRSSTEFTAMKNLVTLPIGVLGLIALQLDSDDYLPFAMTCGRFSRLILDKRFIKRLMYNSLHFHYEVDGGWDYMIITRTNLPIWCHQYHGCTRFWQKIGHLSRYYTHDHTVYKRMTLQSIGFDLETKLSHVSYDICERGDNITYLYHDNVVKYIRLSRNNDGLSIIIHDVDNKYQLEHGILDVELIKEINNNGFDLCYLENLYTYHKYFQKHFEYLYNMPSIYEFYRNEIYGV